jgi:hypothetical protein
MKYFDELKRSMDWLNEKPNTLFLGQAVEYAGTAITNTLKDVNFLEINKYSKRKVCFFQ